MNIVRAAWIAAFAIIVSVMAVGLWWKASQVGRTPAPHSLPSQGPASAPEPHVIDPTRETTAASLPDGRIVWTAAADQTAALNLPDQSARDDIGAVHDVLASYESVFGQLPEGGENAEITRGLRGDNPKKLVFLVDGPGLLDPDGALLDRWGTPYVFHKLSGRLLEIRSAGPDRRLRTPDDVFEIGTNGPPL